MLYRVQQSIGVNLVLAFVILASGLCTSLAAAQSSETTEPVATQEIRCAALQAIQTRLLEGYIFPERAPQIVERLDCRSGRFDADDPAEFARLVTEDLQASSHDTHLYLNFEPEWYAAATIAQDARTSAEENEAEVRHARAFNYGLVEERLLLGDVRYLKIAGFFWVPGESARAYDDALGFLHGGSASIIDLRGNRGGGTEALYYLLSHFMQREAIITTVITPGRRNEIVRAQRVARTTSLTGQPLYILVDERTRSAAEAVAHTVRQLRLGEVVGERTEGANHISDDAAIAPWFRLSVPVSYTEDPVSQTNWEGVGVAPTIPSASADALNTAYAAALERLLQTTPEGETRNVLVWARDGVCPAGGAFSPWDSAPGTFVGSYANAHVELRDGALWLIRSERRPIRLRPLCAGGLFVADDDETFRVRIGPGALVIFRLGLAPQRLESSAR